MERPLFPDEIYKSPALMEKMKQEIELKQEKDKLEFLKLGNSNDELEALNNILFEASKVFDEKGFVSLFPFPANNVHGLRKILTLDWVSRKTKSWPLVPLEDFKFYYTLKDPIPNYNDAFMVKGYAVYHHSADYIFDSVKHGFNSGHLYDDFASLKAILTKYKGKLVVAGGAVLRNIVNYRRKSDCDLFFYGISEQEASDILFDCITLIIINSYSVGEEGDLGLIKVKVEHKLHVTNVIVFSEHTDMEEKYQFIHRIYPTKDSIIGGFDLGPSMVLFDGDQVYGTPLAAYCIAKQCIIVDTSRRSISFEQRIYKLSTFDFKVVFPGINHHYRFPSTVQNSHEYRKLFVLLRKMGWDLNLDPHDRQCEMSYSEYFCKSSIIDLGLIKMDESKLMRPRPLYSTTDDIPRNLLFHYSDYSDLDASSYEYNYESKINGALLRIENFEGVSTSFTFRSDEKYDILSTLVELYKNPKVQYDLDSYKVRCYKYLLREQKSNFENRNLRREIPCFAEFAWKIRHLQDSNRDLAVDYTKSVVDYLANRMTENAALCEENLKGIKWMAQAVGVQWTSSINPIFENPREFYGQYYTPFWIGIPPEIETTLRLFRRRTNNYFALLSKDLFNLLLSYVLKACLFNPVFQMIKSKESVINEASCCNSIWKEFTNSNVKDPLNAKTSKDKYQELFYQNGGQDRNLMPKDLEHEVVQTIPIDLEDLFPVPNLNNNDVLSQSSSDEDF